jgi:hypothetical protein
MEVLMARSSFAARTVGVLVALIMSAQIASAAAKCDTAYQMGLALGKGGTGPGQTMYNNFLALARKDGCETAFIAGNEAGFKMRKDVGDPTSDTSGPK